MNLARAESGAQRAYVIGTIDTKGEELRYVRDLIVQAGIAAVLVDVGPRSRDLQCDVRSEEVAVCHPEGPAAVQTDDRGRAIEAMAEAFSRFLCRQRDVGGVIGLGGLGWLGDHSTCTTGPANWRA